MGKFDPDAPGVDGGGETRASGFEGTHLLYTFFVAESTPDAEFTPDLEAPVAPEN